ncbi:unnamed protein product [Penicillium pancosmium]
MAPSGDDSPNPSLQETNPAGPRRSRSGCTLCRARKVKCDERWPVCLHCERLKLDCPGPPGRGQQSHPKTRKASIRDAEFTQAGTVRQRVAKSCLPCRYAKSRCTGGTCCDRCSRKGVDCIYHPEQNRAISRGNRSMGSEQRDDQAAANSTGQLAGNTLSSASNITHGSETSAEPPWSW